MYEDALREIGAWLSYYDARTNYELYGFSGILDGDESSKDCFLLNKSSYEKMFQVGSLSTSVLEVRCRLLFLQFRQTEMDFISWSVGKLEI